MRIVLAVVALVALFLLAGRAPAQEPYAPAALTAADYERAERLLAQNAFPLIFRVGVQPNWLDDDRFWYRNQTPDGVEFVLVDPAARTRDRMFDQERLAAELSRVADTTYAPLALPFRTFDISDDRGIITVSVQDRRLVCDLELYTCEDAPAEPETPPNSVTSPDGRRAAFVRDHNLWVRAIASGEETQLTTDGVEHFGYATNNAGWVRSDEPVLLWSPDSRRIATIQHDARGVGEMYIVSTTVGHPRLDAWRYPLPGDSLIFRIERVVIDVDAPGGPRVVRFQMPPDQHRSTACDHIVCTNGWADVAWSADSRRFVFVSSSRDHKEAIVRVADVETGEVRDVFDEREEAFYESGYDDANNWHVLSATDEFIWYSAQDDWGHLYLRDLGTGELLGRITEGPWNVFRILRVDEEARTVTFLGNGREPGDAYFPYLYRVGLDGTGLTLLTPDSANHNVSPSPSGRYFVDTYSTPTTPHVAVLRDASGAKVMDLETADVSRLMETGWQPPIPFSVKARDGETDLYGLLYRPTRFDPSLKYPIINSIYPGPQSGSVGSRSFVTSSRQALAELGFVVVAIDAMGTPMRSKSFHEAYYGDMGDNGLLDHITGMRQLAERYPWIDIERVGIYGHSGGGFAAADAILRYPSFFDVAVASSGNHDNRNYEDDWGEKWQGLLVTNPDGTTNYDNQANQLLARNLSGKLLLAHGGMDDNVPPSNTMVLVDALIAANQDFDLLIVPNARHGYGAASLYWERRRWDYFVRHLLGAEPPEEYRIAPPRPLGP